MVIKMRTMRVTIMITVLLIVNVIIEKYLLFQVLPLLVNPSCPVMKSPLKCMTRVFRSESQSLNTKSYSRAQGFSKESARSDLETICIQFF